MTLSTGYFVVTAVLTMRWCRFIQSLLDRDCTDYTAVRGSYHHKQVLLSAPRSKCFLEDLDSRRWNNLRHLHRTVLLMSQPYDASAKSHQPFAAPKASFSFWLRAWLSSLGFAKPLDAFITCLQTQEIFCLRVPADVLFDDCWVRQLLLYMYAADNQCTTACHCLLHAFKGHAVS